MPWLLEWMLFVGLMFVGFGLLGWSALAVERRPHFWIRVLLQCLGVAATMVLLFEAIELKLLPDRLLMLVWLVLVVGVLIVSPLWCYRSAGSAPGPSDGGSGGGGGPGPPVPGRPRGGVPLPDAEQSTARARDHIRPKLRRDAARRPAREPARRPTRTRSLARS